ncbi:MAG: BBP7 family outer membrane beta-barrel protein [Gemmataceae bacterium]
MFSKRGGLTTGLVGLIQISVLLLGWVWDPATSLAQYTAVWEEVPLSFVPSKLPKPLRNSDSLSDDRMARSPEVNQNASPHSTGAEFGTVTTIEPEVEENPLPLPMPLPTNLKDLPLSALPPTSETTFNHVWPVKNSRPVSTSVLPGRQFFAVERTKEAEEHLPLPQTPSQPQETSDAKESPPSTFDQTDSWPSPVYPTFPVEQTAPEALSDHTVSSFLPAGPVGARGVTADVEYLWWFFENMEVPISLASTDTQPLQQNFQFEDRPLSGARFTVGYLFDLDYDPVLPHTPPFRATGVELTGFFLAERSIGFRADTAPTLFRSFFRLNDPQGSSFLVASPGIASGVIFGEADVQLWGVEVNGWRNVFANWPGQTIRIDVMGGLRHLNLAANLSVSSVSAFENDLSGFPELLPFEGTTLAVKDVFQTASRFYGPQVGFSLNYVTSCFIASSDFKFGVGAIHQQLVVEGAQAQTSPGGTTIVSPGGLFAADPNLGTFERTKIGFVPEINVKFTFPIGQQCIFFFGYSFLGMSNALWPGDQIDPVVDTAQLPAFPSSAGTTPARLSRPPVSLTDDFIFIHGLNTGVRFVW